MRGAGGVRKIFPLVSEKPKLICISLLVIEMPVYESAHFSVFRIPPYTLHSHTGIYHAPQDGQHALTEMARGNI